MPDTLKKLNEWADKWTERLYWKGYLLLTLLVVLGFISLSYVLTREVNVLMALFLTLGFPMSILAYHARRSPSAGRLVGRSVYLMMGGSVGALAGIFLLFLIVILVRTITGLKIPAPTLMLAFALGAVWGAMIGDRIGRRREYVFAVAWTR